MLLGGRCWCAALLCFQFYVRLWAKHLTAVSYFMNIWLCDLFIEHLKIHFALPTFMLLLFMHLVVVLYHWGVNTTQTYSRSHWVTVGEVMGTPAVNFNLPTGFCLWGCFAASFTSWPPSWQREKVSKSSLEQNLSSRASVSTRSGLTSPALCSCDLRALCAAWWEEVTQSGEHGTQGWPIFVCSLWQPLHFSKMSQLWFSDLKFKQHHRYDVNVFLLILFF